MAGENLAERIRGMAEYFDAEQIARATGIPLAVVKGVLTGEVPDEALEEYDPARPPDVRVVERRRYVRSRLVGVLSTGGSGATTLAATLSVLAAAAAPGPVTAADFNECAQLGPALGIDTAGEGAALHPNVAWLTPGSGGTADNLVDVPGVEGLKVLLGAATAARHAEVGVETMAAAARALGDTAALAVADCPTSPALWPAFLPVLDLAVVVLRADAASLDALWRVMPVLRGCGAEERAVLAFNFAGAEGMLSEADCRRAARAVTAAPVIGFLPEEPGVRRATARGECFALENPASPFCRAAGEILEAVVPHRPGAAPKKSFFGPLLGIFNKR